MESPRIRALQRFIAAHERFEAVVNDNDDGHGVATRDEEPYLLVALAICAHAIETENAKAASAAVTVANLAVNIDGRSPVLLALSRLMTAAEGWLAWSSLSRQQFDTDLDAVETFLARAERPEEPVVVGESWTPETPGASMVFHVHAAPKGEAVNFVDNHIGLSVDKVFTPESSNVEWYAYDVRPRFLYVKFQISSVVYRYANVAPSIKADLAAAVSKGTFVNQTFVRSKHPYTRLTLDGMMIP